MNLSSSRRPIVVGEVLFDRFEDGTTVLGGAPFNVAWHLQALGVDPLVISRIGRDDAGDEVRRSMGLWGMSTDGLQVDPTRPTGAVNVTTKEGQPTYEIPDGQAYDAIDEGGLPGVRGGLIYHGTLALRTEPPERTLCQIIDTTGADVFVDLNLRDPWWTADLVGRVLNRANVVKMSDDEFRQVAPSSSSPLLEQMKAARRGWKLRTLVVTCGADGALGVSDSGVSRVTPQGGETVVDAVGAGDAFASVLIVGHILGWDLTTTMARAQALASRIVGIQGATAPRPELYADLLTSWNLD